MQTNNQNLIKKLKCPVCGGGLFVDHKIINCKDCNVQYGFENNIPRLLSKEVNQEHLVEETELFEKMQEAWIDNRVSISTSQWHKSKQEFWGRVRDELGEKEKKDVLNIGCGYDDAFVEFEFNGHRFVNLDIIESSLKYLQEKYQAKYCVVADINNIPFKNNSFDVIVCIDILHHEGENLDRILASVYKILKPGGVLYLEDINAWGLFQFYKSILLPKFMHTKLRSLYHKLRKSEHIPAVYEFPTNPFKMKDKLKRVGFKNIKFYKKKSYPESGQFKLAIYKLFTIFGRINKYHNYHYFLNAKK